MNREVVAVDIEKLLAGTGIQMEEVKRVSGKEKEENETKKEDDE